MFEKEDLAEPVMKAPNEEQIRALSSADLMALLTFAESRVHMENPDTKIFMYTAIIVMKDELRNRILNFETK